MQSSEPFLNLLCQRPLQFLGNIFKFFWCALFISLFFCKSIHINIKKIIQMIFEFSFSSFIDFSCLVDSKCSNTSTWQQSLDILWGLLHLTFLARGGKLTNPYSPLARTAYFQWFWGQFFDIHQISSNINGKLIFIREWGVKLGNDITKRLVFLE